MRNLFLLGFLAWPRVAEGAGASAPITASFINLGSTPGIYVTPTDNVWRIGGDAAVNITLDTLLAEPTLRLGAAGLRSAGVRPVASRPNAEGPQYVILTVNYE